MKASSFLRTVCVCVAVALFSGSLLSCESIIYNITDFTTIDPAVASRFDSAQDFSLLSLSGNPMISKFDSSRTKWSADKADIVLSYQQSNGGWPKNLNYSVMGSGGGDAGTFDNGATVTEIVYMAERYAKTGNAKYKEAVRKAALFIVRAQYSSGGWPQFYPLRGDYYDHATYNDDAMARVLTVLHCIVEQRAPFNIEFFSEDEIAVFKLAIYKGVDYILKSQYKRGVTLTVWCAQHGAYDYQPKQARAYELPSLSGMESVGIVAFLMTQPQIPEIEAAVKAALTWYRSPDSYLADHYYDSSEKTLSPIKPKAGSKMWYRFYRLDTNRGFFSDRTGLVFYNIMEIQEERRTGYQWGGSYGDKIGSYAASVGY
jgi:PelA/Pel-15E family pectate lyase